MDILERVTYWGRSRLLNLEDCSFYSLFYYVRHSFTYIKAIFLLRPRSQGGEWILLNFLIQEAILPNLPINRAVPYHLGLLVDIWEGFLSTIIFLFMLGDRIMISSIGLRLSGVTLGFLNFPILFSQTKFNSSKVPS